MNNVMPFAIQGDTQILSVYPDKLDDLIKAMEFKSLNIKAKVPAGVFVAVVNELEKQKKYAWHDLRKDPQDLPEKDGLYAVCIDFDGKNIGFGQWETLYGYGAGWSALMPNIQAVIAWREIEPFEGDGNE